MQCVAPFELYHIILIHCVHYYLDTPVPPQIPPIHHMEYGPKPFFELREHNDFHLQTRRLSYILSIAICQRSPSCQCSNRVEETTSDDEGEKDIQLIEERLESLH
jgi:hypothetical protein